MLTVSLHGIKLHAKVGLYPQEKINGNNFEVDVDVFVEQVNESEDLPFIDYAIIHEIVIFAFQQPGELLETFVMSIYQEIKKTIHQQGRVRVSIKKMIPPLGSSIEYAQVSFEG